MPKTFKEFMQEEVSDTENELKDTVVSDEDDDNITEVEEEEYEDESSDSEEEVDDDEEELNDTDSADIDTSWYQEVAGVTPVADAVGIWYFSNRKATDYDIENDKDVYIAHDTNGNNLLSFSKACTLAKAYFDQLGNSEVVYLLP